MNKKTVIKVVYILYLLFLIAFIFSNSVASQKESAEESGRILAFVNNILETLHFPFSFTHEFVRKAAHFVEFFVLGISIFGYLKIDKKIDVNKTVHCIFAACLVAMTDETIQYFSDRGSMLLDVWLDSFAASVAIILFYLIYKHKKRPKKEG